MIWLGFAVIALLCFVAAWSERQAPPLEDDLLELFDEEEPH